MGTFFEAMNKTATTDNGALAYHTSLSANLDLFYVAGASRGKDISCQVLAAVAENPDIALRLLQWLRDARGGAGERQLFRDAFATCVAHSAVETSVLTKLLHRIPEIGRFDDLIWCIENLGTELAGQATQIFCQALEGGNKLAFKWAPVKGATAKILRKRLGFATEKDWRKHIVANRQTVEQDMCANNWEAIEFSKVPSLASARYQKAFGRHAPEAYGAYIEALTKQETTINAGAVYPYDVYKSCYNGNPEVANQQWKALPNYLEGSEERILPLVDVSGSMGCSAGGSKSLSCMDVAVSLGWYLAEKQTGAFKNMLLTFESSPKFYKGQDGLPLAKQFDNIKSLSWGGSTNVIAAFKLVLNTCLQHQVSPQDMPTMICILSDMQFNEADHTYNMTAFEKIKTLYQNSGYALPRVAFWNLNASNKSIPVTKHATGAMLVSGFSPSLMKGILQGSTTPEQVMLDTLMVDRYNLDLV